MSDMSSRRSSLSSERSFGFHMPPPTIRPKPSYIAASVASQTVTDNQSALRQDYGSDAAADELENAIFSEQALSLLNAFLDHILFAILAAARSPSLTAIRPAIAEVLKPRLAHEAAEAADEELQGLLSAEDDEGLPAYDAKAVDRWDVEKVWKRTRLRIMVYTRLGEMEDEDEERYVQQERGLSMDEDEDDEAGLVSWASAIFLTSVVEYVAEQTLMIAGQAAFTRTAAKVLKAQQSEDSEPQSLERLVIEEPDVEKIALNSALGRLWRTWRKRVRSSTQPHSPLSPGRGIRPISSYTSLHRRKDSYATLSESLRGEPSSIPEYAPTETEIAANIPLPISDNDVNEIEVPGLAWSPDDENNDIQSPISYPPRRPSSVIMLAPAESFRRSAQKERPFSMPPPGPVPFTIPDYSRSEQQEVSAMDPEIVAVDSEAVPVESEVASVKSEVAPAESEVTPVESEATPVESEIVPIESAASVRSVAPVEPAASTESEIDLVESEAAAETPFETPLTSMTHRTSFMNNYPQETLPPLEEVESKEKDDSVDEPEADADMVAFAASTGMGFRMSTFGPMKTETPDNLNDDEPRTYPSLGDEAEPKVLRSKRMSIERSGPPGIVRTFSSRSASLKSPAMTPKPSPIMDARSYLDLSDDDTEGAQAIGVARTADKPIRSTPTPPLEPVDRSRYAAHGGFAEVQPRSSARNTPTPDAKPSIPERSVARNDSLKKRSPSFDNVVDNGPIVAAASPPRKRDATPPTSRTSLPSLQETEHAESEQAVHRRSPTISIAKSNRSRDALVTVAERQLPRRSTDDSIRSRPSIERPGVKRVASSASGKASGNYAHIPGGRDSIGSQMSRHHIGRMSEGDREREFDSLVKGEETVKFTLTPENMRALDESKPQRPAASSTTVYPRVSADRDNSFGTNSLPSKPGPKGKVPSASHHKPSPSRKVVTRPLAREPRIESESMRDFADFIRSTGPPPGHEKPVQPFVNISGNGSTSAHGPSSSLGRKPSIKQSSPTTRLRVNMEPRSPAGLSDGHDDLIDFIRQGPPNGPEGQPRIPRSVAPFRTTVDSDQFDSMLGDHANVESAYGSKSSTLDSSNSIQTANSRTGLIPAPSIVQPAYSSAPQQLSGNMASNSDPVITRTRRRVKDPYAIDLSDEDEDDEDEDEEEDRLTALPTSNRPQPPRQESLMDFLNDEPPPTVSQPQPFMLSEQTIAAAKARANGSNSARANSSNSSISSAATTTRNGAAPPLGFPAPNPANAPRAHKGRPGARAPSFGEGGSRSATSDLADFLRNSGPPEPTGPPPGKKEEEKKRGGMRFWRKKTYPDMP